MAHAHDPALHEFDHLSQEAALPRPTVAASLISGFADYAVRHGANQSDLFRVAGLKASQLSNPDRRIPFDQFISLVRAAKTKVDRPALPLLFGEDIGVSQVSIVGLIMEASATMGEAFVQLQRYGRLAADVDDNQDTPRFDLAQEGNKLFMVDHISNADAIPELVEIAFASLTCGPRRFLDQPHVLSIHLSFPAPDYADEYTRIFQCPVHFSAGRNALELHPQIASWPVSSAPNYLFGVLTKHADKMLEKLVATQTVVGKVEALLLPALHRGHPDADTIASQLGFHRHTLFRKLKEEGTTFSAVRDGLRERTAKAYLEGGKASVNETAYLVGFSDPAAFSRAFKRWTGLTPNDFRKTRASAA